MCEFNLIYFHVQIMRLLNAVEKVKLTLNSKKMEV